MLDPGTQRRQRARNIVQSTLLLGCLLAVAAGLAWLLLGTLGLIWTLVLGAVVLVLRPRMPPRVVLTMYRAQPLPREAAPELNWLVDQVAERACLHHRPALFYVPSRVPNCFCTGHGRGAVLAVTDGILRTLTRREMAGVLAHELAHLHAGDTRVMSLTDAISRLTRFLGLLGMVGFALGLAR